MKTRAVLLLVAIVAASSAAAEAASFDRKAWREDYSTLKRELEQSYSHLAWAASPASGVDLPSLDRRTRLALDAARSDADAAAALVSFVAAFHDGHFAPTVTPEPSGAGPEPPPRPADNEASAACAAAGYSPATRIAFSLPFESLTGFRMESDGISRAFRSGTILVGERRAGLVRIPRFRPAEYPALCLATWPALDEMDAAWLKALADRLAAFRAQHVDAVLVDVGGNGGGNDLGDWAARLFTSGDVRSAPLLMHAGPLGAKYMDEQLQGLNDALAAHRGDTKVEAVLRPAIDAFEWRRRESLQQSCDLSWVWREQRRFDPTKCSGLIDAGFASGALSSLAPGSLARDAASALYWPSIADSMRGAWNGPVYLLTDSATASAAEMFAARMHDSGIARTVGVRTLGLGCGSMVENAPFTLPHSHLSFRIPNCVRLRADGSDEVAGIAPDLPVLPAAKESARARAARVLSVIGRELSQVE
ncbi:MAG TPA: S41 family peptidase [Steroidobacteraceae bacterium]|nr:S41 family peptidase [Steroidobacteraceae bacterium]